MSPAKHSGGIGSANFKPANTVTLAIQRASPPAKIDPREKYPLRIRFRPVGLRTYLDLELELDSTSHVAKVPESVYTIKST